MSIKESLEKQIMYCKSFPMYRCGIYIKRMEKKDYIMDELKKLLFSDIMVTRVINSSFLSEVHFENGSVIKIIRASDNARGHKNNGAIIDREMDDETLRCIIMPSLIPRVIIEPVDDSHSYVREPWAEIEQRILFCDM